MNTQDIIPSKENLRKLFADDVVLATAKDIEIERLEADPNWGPEDDHNIPYEPSEGEESKQDENV